jgi:hypothetical protein
VTIKSAPYYWAVCDRCGDRHEYEEYTAWADADTPDDMAQDSGWHVEGGNHICEDCIPHGPDWDEMHEAFFAGEVDALVCGQCNPLAEEKTHV